jgi:hypothetical protein
MGRFFFDFIDGDALFVDSEGTDLIDESHVELEATRTLAEIALDRLPEYGPRRLALTVRDEGGRQIMTASLTLQIQRSN